MGDTGSLSLGGALAGLAILTRTELLLLILGGLFVDHHAVGDPAGRLLQGPRPRSANGCSGWRRCSTTSSCSAGSEVTIVIRFWIIPACASRPGSGIFYAEWVGRARERRTDVRLAGPATTRWDGVPRRRGRASASPGSPRPTTSPTRCSAGAAHVAVLDDRRRRAACARRPQLLEVLGADVTARRRQYGDAARRRRPGRHVAWLTAARAAARSGRAEREVPVWGEVELAWRLRDPDARRAVAGRHRHQRQDHDRADARRDPARRGPAQRRGGNVGLPLVEAVMDPEPYDVLAVELSSFQLHCTRLDVRGTSAAVLNVAADHLDWYGSMDDYAADKGRIYERCQLACVYNVADPATERLVPEADVDRGLPRDRLHPRHARRSAWSAWSTTSWSTAPSSSSERRQRRRAVPRSPTSVRPRRTTSPTRWPPPRWPGRTAYRRRGPRRAARVPARRAPDRGRRGRRRGRYVDDSKATNPHAAQASLLGLRPRGVGRRGLGQGRDVRRPGDRGPRPAARRRAARARPGRDRGGARATRARCPGRSWSTATDTGAMERVVGAAAGLARPGDTVLLAPAAPPWTCSRTTRARGDAFAAAVRRLRATRLTGGDRRDIDR